MRGRKVYFGILMAVQSYTRMPRDPPDIGHIRSIVIIFPSMKIVRSIQGELSEKVEFSSQYSYFAFLLECCLNEEADL